MGGSLLARRLIVTFTGRNRANRTSQSFAVLHGVIKSGSCLASTSDDGER